MRLIARLNVGGPAIHATLLTQRLNPQQFDSSLITGVEGAHEGNMIELMNAGAQNSMFAPISPTIVPEMGREISPRHDLHTLNLLVRMMRRQRPHIVHTHTAKAGFVGRVAARIARVPVVVHTFHGNIFQGYFSPAKTRLFVGIEKTLARSTDRIVVLSEQQKAEILALGIGREPQFRTIPLGLNLEAFVQADALRGQLRAELGVEAATPLVGIVARLVPIKAIHLFLEAAQSVLKTRPDALFLVVGDGELRAELEQQSRTLGIEKSVRFLGFRADLPRIYADLDCVVLCSLNEGLPVAVIEALSAARPVVATDVGSVKNLVINEQTGLLVPSQNVEALAKGIMRALDEPEQAQKWAVAGRERVYPALGIDRLVGDIETLYLEALASKQS